MLAEGHTCTSEDVMRAFTLSNSLVLQKLSLVPRTNRIGAVRDVNGSSRS